MLEIGVLCCSFQCQNGGTSAQKLSVPSPTVQPSECDGNTAFLKCTAGSVPAQAIRAAFLACCVFWCSLPSLFRSFIPFKTFTSAGWRALKSLTLHTAGARALSSLDASSLLWNSPIQISSSCGWCHSWPLPQVESDMSWALSWWPLCQPSPC